MRASARELLYSTIFTPLVWCDRRIRTRDLPLRKQMRYILGYRGRKAEGTAPSGPPELAIVANRSSHQHYYSVAPSPAAPAGCRPLYLLLSFTWAPNRCCILHFRAYQRYFVLTTPIAQMVAHLLSEQGGRVSNPGSTIPKV